MRTPTSTAPAWITAVNKDRALGCAERCSDQQKVGARGGQDIADSLGTSSPIRLQQVAHSVILRIRWIINLN